MFKLLFPLKAGARVCDEDFAGGKESLHANRVHDGAKVLNTSRGTEGDYTVRDTRYFGKHTDTRRFTA